MNKGVTFDEGLDIKSGIRTSFGFVVLGFLLMLSLAASATHSLAQSIDYDEEKDLAVLASNQNVRMHYQRLSSPLRSKETIWQGLERVIEAMPTDSDDYRRLEALVVESVLRSCSHWSRRERLVMKKSPVSSLRAFMPSRQMTSAI